MQIEDSGEFLLGSSCTKNNQCSSIIKNSNCLAGHCKCSASYGASSDKKSCLKSKKFGESCHPIKNKCNAESLVCSEEYKVCKCSSDYKLNHVKTVCQFVNFADSCSLDYVWDESVKRCIQNREFWFPTYHQRPKLSILTFLLLIIFCAAILRKNSINNSTYSSGRRRNRTSNNLSRNNNLSLLYAILNYDYNQRYTNRNNNSGGNQRNWSNINGDDEQNDNYYHENLPPPAYDEIFNSASTSIKNENNGTRNTLNLVSENRNDDQSNNLEQINNRNDFINHTHQNHLNRSSSELELQNDLNNQDDFNLKSSSFTNSNQDVVINCNLQTENNLPNNESSTNLEAINENQIDVQHINVTLSNVSSLNLEDQKLPTYEEAITMPPI